MFLNITFSYSGGLQHHFFSFLFLVTLSKENSGAFDPASCRTMISYVSALKLSFLMLFNTILLYVERLISGVFLVLLPSAEQESW